MALTDEFTSQELECEYETAAPLSRFAFGKLATEVPPKCFSIVCCGFASDLVMGSESCLCIAVNWVSIPLVFGALVFLAV
jgi:hypothetical protein